MWLRITHVDVGVQIFTCFSLLLASWFRVLAGDGLVLLFDQAIIIVVMDLIG
jgi:hypothetical protein